VKQVPGSLEESWTRWRPTTSSCWRAACSHPMIETWWSTSASTNWTRCASSTPVRIRAYLTQFGSNSASTRPTDCHRCVLRSPMAAAPKHELSREDLAWAAGFFDRRMLLLQRRGRYACISIAQTNREPLDRFQRVVECRKVLGPYDHKGPGRYSRKRVHCLNRFNTYKPWSRCFGHAGYLKRAQARAMLSKITRQARPPENRRSQWLRSMHCPILASASRVARRRVQPMASLINHRFLDWLRTHPPLTPTRRSHHIAGGSPGPGRQVYRLAPSGGSNRSQTDLLGS
jgi:hypothetical protein